MSNYQTGHDAEKLAAEWLRAQGFKIVELNWRTRQCEIDIVVCKKKTLYFVEVKSRASSAWGSAIDYITAKKLEQMKFAAEIWAAENDWGYDIRLAAVAVDGNQFSFVEILD
jgi:uncharacterized protein (TIGR00252 family)